MGSGAIFLSSQGTSKPVSQVSAEGIVWGRKGAHSLQRPGLHPGSLVLQNDLSPAAAIAAAQQPAWNPCCHPPPPHWHIILLYLLSHPHLSSSLRGNLDRQQKCMALLRATWDPLSYPPGDFLLSASYPRPKPGVTDFIRCINPVSRAQEASLIADGLSELGPGGAL